MLPYWNSKSRTKTPSTNDYDGVFLVLLLFSPIVFVIIAAIIKYFG